MGVYIIPLPVGDPNFAAAYLTPAELPIFYRRKKAISDFFKSFHKYIGYQRKCSEKLMKLLFINLNILMP